jgi:uncharacterized membrane protein
LNGFPLPDNGEFYHSSIGGTTQWLNHMINVIICLLVACFIAYYLEKRIYNKTKKTITLIIITLIYVIGIPASIIDYYCMISPGVDAWPEKLILKSLKFIYF